MSRIHLSVKWYLSMGKDRTYIAIDLKSFYASVECVERGLNPLNTNLVVADANRTEKTICLAVSPSLKGYGISGRARLFEASQRVRDLNRQRLYTDRYTIKQNDFAEYGGKDTYYNIFPEEMSKLTYRKYVRSSVFADVLNRDPGALVDFIVAPPRMAYYIQYSTRIYNVYLKYIAPEDIHVYSIDEVIIDATPYLDIYNLTARELAIKMIRDVLASTGITATAGIGPNMYLCKVAMDVVAKHIPADKDGVRIAELDEISYRRQLWGHLPLTDFWRFGKGTVEKLLPYGIRTLGDIARCSLNNEELLYKLFGVNAELLIDHAWGWEPCTISDVKAYKPESHSLSYGQVLSEPYSLEKGRIVVREMADGIALDLVDKKLVTDQLVMTLAYDRSSLSPSDHTCDEILTGVKHDAYGRLVPDPSRGTENLSQHTSSAQMITKAALALYDRIAKKGYFVRKLNISACHVIKEKDALEIKQPIQLELFTDYEEQEAKAEVEKTTLARERSMQEAILSIKKKYGKNSILKGTDFADGATTRERNSTIGGHKA